MLTRLRVLAARTKAFFMTYTLDRDFESELESHLAMLAEEYVRRGMTPEEGPPHGAPRDGRVGSRQRAAPEDTGPSGARAALMQDVRYALRSLRRDAGFATRSRFSPSGSASAPARRSTAWWMPSSGGPCPSAIQDVWFGSPTRRDRRTVRLDHPDRALSRSPGEEQIFLRSGRLPCVLQRRRHKAHRDRRPGAPHQRAGDDRFLLFPPESAPSWARLFNADEGKAQWHRPQVALLSYGFWKRRFAADPAIVGQKLTLDGSAVTVVGVLPESFDFAAVFAPGDAIDLFFPLPLTAEADRRGNTISVLGRLKPGVTVESAQAELSALAKQISEQHPRRNRLEPIIGPHPGEHVSGPFRRALAVLGAAPWPR